MVVSIVAATRYDEEEFWSLSALGQSLERLHRRTDPNTCIAYENTKGLPEVYNYFLSERATDDAIVFVHDDVWIDDYHLVTRIVEGLQWFDVIGVTGNRKRMAGQPSWNFIDTALTWDDLQNLSGAIAHGDYPFGEIHYYGPSPAECELLDGVLLAFRTASITQANLSFDPIFRFHFYDLDYCRQARQAGLRLGTWPIAVTHQSGGVFGSTSWHESYRHYLRKLGEAPRP
ncbi:MAG: hypothetical protein ACK5N0_04855 [Synechococcaceae cyanobacterium]